MTFRITTLSHFRLAAITLAAAVLSACGGGSSPPPDPLASFKQQKLDWQSCDSTILGRDVTYFEELGERAKCALMRAPLDYAEPQKGELKVALLKVAGTDPAKRRGAILFNPGGPGNDGLFLAPQTATLWKEAIPESPNGKLMKELEAQYDLIGFSPRGMGASTTLVCLSTEQMVNENSLTFDRSPANIAAAQHNARLTAKTCGKNPLTPYINTDATARDMDLLRAILGDERLNFIGYSYGTWLGAWYASLFPERVGRMLLDSSMDATATFDDAIIGMQMGRQRLIDRILVSYAARHPDRFNLGTTPEQVAAAIQPLAPEIKALMVRMMPFYKQYDVERGVWAMMGAIGLHQLRVQMPGAGFAELNAAIAQYPFSPTVADNDQAKGAAQGMNNALFMPAQPRIALLEPSAAVYQTVICNDTATQGDEQYWVEVGNQTVAKYPLLGGGSTSNPCLHWGNGPVKRPSLTNAGKADPILLLQSRFDTATPIEGAEATLAALPNASMVLIEDDYTHALYPYGDTCADTSVLEYLASGKMPPRKLTCAGKPLPGEAEAGGATANKAIASTYRDPAKAQQIMRSIHEITRPAGDRF
ncbi:MAG: alpha/beta hydrolase [Burkholderiaceae bacterium]